MLSQGKPARNEEKPRFFREQNRLTGYSKKHVEKPVSDNHLLNNQIEELEEEIARLRSTVQFYQDIYLLDD